MDRDTLDLIGDIVSVQANFVAMVPAAAGMTQMVNSLQARVIKARAEMAKAEAAAPPPVIETVEHEPPVIQPPPSAEDAPPVV